MNHQHQLPIMTVSERIQKKLRDKEIRMNNLIPSIYYEKSIIKLIDDYIDIGHLSYKDLSYGDKECLAAECLSVSDIYCFCESIDLIALQKYLVEGMKTGDMKTGASLFHSMRQTATEYFSDILTSLFEERYRHLECIRNIDNGLVSSRDKETGEVIWRKAI